jgi:carboxymethylenebutenolidase
MGAGQEIDPMLAASPALNRRAFVGASAAAATLAASAAEALGQQPALGQPHPPLVAENDPAISAEQTTLARPDAVLPAYAAWPTGAAQNTPSIVVIMHIWGVDTSIRDVVRRFAKAGFAAIAPDLYGRFEAPSGDGATDSSIFRPYARRLDRAQYDGDIRAAADWLRAKFPKTKTGITGFCMGGHIVLLAASDDAGIFSAACPFYGSPKEVDPAGLRVPVCGSYGARDQSIPADEVRTFFAALKVPSELKIYDNAGHAFFDDQRPSYVAAAAADAWARTLDFFHKYLAPDNP